MGLQILPDALTRRRSLAGLSRHGLAAKSGVSYTRIAHIEGRQTSPGVQPQTAKALADALECQVEDIAQFVED